jgi:predicted DNA-binding ribbon-helix-helix protein
MSNIIETLPAQSANKKRSVVVAGHRTSVSLENIFWDHLRRIARVRRMSVNELVTEIDRGRNGSLSSAIRVFVLKDLRGSLVGIPGVHARMGQGMFEQRAVGKPVAQRTLHLVQAGSPHHHSTESNIRLNRVAWIQRQGFSQPADPSVE